MDTTGVVLTREISGAPYPLRALDVPVHAFALLKGNLLASILRYTAVRCSSKSLIWQALTITKHFW